MKSEQSESESKICSKIIAKNIFILYNYSKLQNKMIVTYE